VAVFLLNRQQIIMTSALIIIDVQTALCAGPWATFEADKVVDRINTLSGQARAAGIPVVFVQHEEEQGSLQLNTDGWQLYERLTVQPEDGHIRKAGSDAFHQTELLSVLQTHGVSRLVVCGMQSEFCVDSTVRAALALGYPVTLVEDGHTTLDNGVLSAAQISAHHNMTLANLGSYGPRATTIPAEQVRLEA